MAVDPELDQAGDGQHVAPPAPTVTVALDADGFRALAAALQQELETLALAREEFDVLADVAEQRRRALEELERRIEALTTQRGALEAELSALRESAAEPVAEPALAGGGGHAERMSLGRVRGEVRRFARTAATETARLRADLAQRSQQAAAELEALRAERDALARDAAAARGEAETARAEAGAARADAEAARAEAADARAQAEAARAEAGKLRAHVDATASGTRAPAARSFTVRAGRHPQNLETESGGGVIGASARSLMLLLALVLAVGVGMLLLKGYSAYCAGNPCG